MSKNQCSLVYSFLAIAVMMAAVVVLSSSAMADVVERYNAAGELTASGSDVGAVQTESGFTEGDVIKLSGTATHNTSIPYKPESDGGVYHIQKYTIQSSTPGVKQTINAGNTRLYNFNDGANTYDITLKDLEYKGYKDAVSNAIGLYMHTSPACTLDIKTDNVSFTGFKASTHHGGVFGLDGSGNLKITAINGLVFEGNRSNASTGGAIHVNSGSFTITADTLTFKDNYAKTYGGAIRAASGTITAGTLLFEGNNTSGNDAGAIYATGAFTINGSSADAVTTFNGNYTLYKGGAIRCDGKLTLKTGTFNFTGNYDTSTNNDNNKKWAYGGAVHADSIDTDAKKINFDSNVSKYYGGGLSTGGGTLKADTIIFNKNSANNFGGGIKTTGALTVTGKSVSFTDNYASNNDGGAIEGGNVTLKGIDANSLFTFSGNYTKYLGGAIATGSLELNTGTFKFTNNSNNTSSSSYSYGGAVNCSSFTSNAKEIKFDSNTSKYYGGGLSIKGSGTSLIQADTITFNKNKADCFGGAIHLNGGTLNITGDDIKFTDNATTGANSDGGAIRGVNSAALVITVADEDSTALFSGNTSTRYGGALSVSFITLSTGSFTFSNNSTGTQGGAIYAESVTFSGEGTVGTFTGNAAGVGNDIYLINANSVLTFQDAGTYSFDGGIVLADAATKTFINQAQVTIAGREGDNTNAYQLQNVSISNGGKLTAELDNINSATGTFTLNDNSSVLEFKTDSADAKRFDNTIAGSGTLLKTGEGVLALDGTEEHPITASSLTAESGSLLFNGDYTGDLTIKDGALFSPGNSVGTLTMDGNFTAESGSTLLFEQDATGIDQLIIQAGRTLNVANDAILEIAASSFAPGATFTLIDSVDGLTGEYASDAFWNGLLTPESAYFWNLYVDGGVLYAAVDPNAVPEPSTWALLVLGAAGLLYWRKRK